MTEENITTEMTVEKPMNGARQELETLLNEILPEEKRTGDVEQMALDWIREQRDMNNRLSEVLSKEPEMAQLFAEVINGAKPSVSLIRHLGRDLVNAEEGSPEYEELMEADNAYKKDREQLKQAQIAFDEKAAAWFEAFKGYCERMKLNYDTYLVKVEDEVISPALDWDISDEFFDRLVKAVDYDKDVDDAFEAGEIKGRNTNIHEMRSKPSDGMPSGLSSQAPVVEKSRKRNRILESALGA